MTLRPTTTLLLLLPVLLAVLCVQQVSSAARGSLQYRDADVCEKWELRFVRSYDCVAKYDRLICWAMLNILERAGCTVLCTKFEGQHCVPSGTSCSSAEGLCDTGFKCCSFPE